MISISFVIVFLSSLVVSILAVPLAIWLSHRFGIVSQPGGRRQETAPMPKLGGIAIFAGFMFGILIAQILPVPRQDPYEVIRWTGLFLGGGVVFFVGILDDIFEFGYFPLFLSQLVAGGIAVFFQIFIQYVNNPFTGQQTDPWPHLVTVTLTIFWVALMMNTVNFLDGLDGLAAGVAIIASLTLFVNSAFRVEPAQISVSLLPLALAGACLGFLLFNFHPAQIYMGGTALYLGFVLAALSIIGGAKMATILLVMGLPLTDLALQAVSRLLQGRNPFSGDRGHVHFRLQDSGILTHRQIVLLYYGFCSFFGGLTLIVESQLFKFVAFAVMLGLILLGFAFIVKLRPQSSSE